MISNAIYWWWVRVDLLAMLSADEVIDDLVAMPSTADGSVLTYAQYYLQLIWSIDDLLVIQSVLMWHRRRTSNAMNW